MSDLVSLYSLTHSHKHKHTHGHTNTHTYTHNITDKRNYKQITAYLVYNRVIQWRYMTVLVTISSSKNVILV